VTASNPEIRKLSSEERSVIAAACRDAYPHLEAVYVFGSRAAGAPHPGSDCDVAVLLPPQTAHRAGALALSDLHQTLERRLRREVDLVNLRLASTVFAKEVVATGERIECADPAAADEFEALTFSLYQELNVERADLLRDFERTGLAFAP